VSLRITADIPAGRFPTTSIGFGEAARILTGSMMPEGADTVVMQEQTQRSGDVLQILQTPPEKGHFVRHRGSFYRAGDRLLDAGLKISGPEIAVLAAAQCLQVPVFRRLKVGILSTGTELVPPEQSLLPGQIVDSNQVALGALLLQAGFEAERLGIVQDDRATLKQAMADAIACCDVVISSGGVSVGDYDYVESLLAELKGTIHVRAIAIKPGKPFTFATFQAVTAIALRSHAVIPTPLYFGLPGNPVSALVTFWRFVLPALHRVSGQKAPAGAPAFMTEKTQQPLKSDGRRETYLWGTLQATGDIPEFFPAEGSGSSGNLVNLAGSTALAILPIGQTLAKAGDPIRVMRIL